MHFFKSGRKRRDKMDNVLEQLRQIFVKYNVEKVVLFGSRARGDHSDVSDYDIAVFEKALSAIDEAGLFAEVEGIDSLIKIDLVFIREGLNDDLMANILMEGLVIYEKTKYKLNNFKDALKRLEEAVETFRKNEAHDVIRDGVIQRFEYTYELAWKAAKEYLEDVGIVEKNSPKAVIQEAYAQKLILNEKNWSLMIKDRNMTAHIYKEEMAKEISERIKILYIDEFEVLLRNCQKR
ncbi:MAG: HI0074 family nucleotidyltransferase substrate-binding subunit [Bacillota bacterium]